MSANRERRGDCDERGGLSLTEGLTNARLSQLVEIALERRPELAEWIDGPLLTSRGWPAGREALARAHASPHDIAAHDRLA
ncbi:hypothetical protein [Sphingopyxis sp.]|uniref:hypothetical protein n=1 Tax=Sphingopyxis sp. TaxID=1908224 RepID=UPI003450EE20